MKPYQDHDPIKDTGKAEPKPKRPTQSTYRVGTFSGTRIRPGEFRKCCRAGHQPK